MLIVNCPSIFDIPQMTIQPTLWQHQSDAIAMATYQPATMLHVEMGAGKSLITIETIRRLTPALVLIICPLVVISVWRRELTKWGLDDSYRCYFLQDGSSTQKAAEIKELGSRAIVVVNYEAQRSGTVLEQLRQYTWNMVVCDESQRIKNSETQTARGVYDIAQGSTTRLALSGTPTPSSPLDIHGQYRFLDETIFGADRDTFHQRYGVAEKAPGTREITYRRVKRDALPELRERYKRIAFRAGKEVLQGLPPATHQQIDVQLSDAGRQAYQDFERSQATRIDGQTWTASTIEIVLLRLQQITGGFVRNGDRSRQIDTAKRDALEYLLTTIASDESVVVFARFRDDLRAIAEAARNTGRPYGEVSGNRRDLTEHATMPSTPGLVLGVQIAAGGLGVDLTAASYGIYYSVDFVPGNYEQSLARLHRPGQQHPVHFYHFVATNTVDELIYRALESKQDAIFLFLNERNFNVKSTTAGRNPGT